MRSNEWLVKRLEEIWQVLIPEINKQNKVIIKFKGKWKNKFGQIRKLKDGSTEIIVNSLFRNEKVPEYLIDTTIAHELIHYIHGFHSPLPKQFTPPHKGGIVDKELKNRGFSYLLKLEKNCVKNTWWSIYPSLREDTS